MNQIPNIEDEFNTLFGVSLSYDRELIESILDWHHQQLQKARHDWLREEIVRLEGVKVTKDEIDQAKYSNGNPVQRPEIKQLIEWVNHRTIQTIIDRYHSELDQEVSK